LHKRFPYSPRAFNHSKILKNYHIVNKAALPRNMGGPRSLIITSQSLRNPSGQYWTAKIRVNWLTKIQLLLLTFATGIQDAIAIIDYRCLHSAQTGNTVILALSLSFDTTGYRPALPNGASSLGGFVVGSFMTGQCSRFTGHRQRAWQFALGMVQTCLIFGAVWIQYVHGTQETGLWTCIALALLSSAAGSQIAAARAWDVPEITTAMATAAWVDLSRDSLFYMWRNRSRDLRLSFFAALVSGVAVGGWLRRVIGAPGTLVVSAVIKALVHISVLVASVDCEDLDGEIIPL
jgi:uncharacterized membrane protein YoaK (UPF0700 family)